jgi:hypothetical protein
MVGWVFIVVGVLIVFYSQWYVAKQQNEAGVEVYSNFFSMLAHRGVAIAIGVVGVGVALVGLVTLLGL